MPVSYGSNLQIPPTDKLSSPSCSTRTIHENFVGKVRRMDHYQKNDKTERARGVGGKKGRR